MAELSVAASCSLCHDQEFFFNDNGSVTECVCKANQVMEMKIPTLYTPPDTWIETPALKKAWERRLSVIFALNEGLDKFKRQACPALAQLIFEGKRCRLFDGLKLSSIYFNKDPEFESTSGLYSYLNENIDLVLVLVGFSDPNINNRHIVGDIITSMFAHCKLHRIPFWALLNISLDEIQKHYGEQLYPFLNSIKYKLK